MPEHLPRGRGVLRVARMKHRTFYAVFAFFLTCGSLVCISCAKKTWLTSFEEAKNAASKKNQHILLFIGDGASADFKKDILDSAEFVSRAKKNNTLFYADVSNDTLEQKSAYEHIATDYNPLQEKNMYVLSYEGYILGVIKHCDTFSSGADLFNAVLEAEKDAGRFVPLLEAVRKTEDPLRRVYAIDEFFEASDEKYRRPLVPLCRTVLLLDKENKSGLVGKYELFLAHIEVEPFLNAKDIDKAAKIFTDVCQTGHLDVHQQFLAYYEAAYVHTLVKDIQYNAVLDLLQKAYDTLALETDAKEISEVEATMDVVRAMKKLQLAYTGEVE